VEDLEQRIAEVVRTYSHMSVACWTVPALDSRNRHCRTHRTAMMQQEQAL
jgi:hypothetical protein